MRRVAIVLSLVACHHTAPPVAPADDTVVRTDGWGKLRFGMDVETAARTAGEPIDAAAEGCVMVTIGAGTPAGVTWMIDGGVLVRLDVLTPALQTDAGAKVGTSATTLRRMYPDAIEEPNKYDPDGTTWIAGPAAAAHYVFELDGTREVVRWRAGLPPQIDWVEGCG